MKTAKGFVCGSLLERHVVSYIDVSKTYMTHYQ